LTLSISTRFTGTRELLVTLSGEVDYATAQSVRQAISAALAPSRLDTIVVDVSGVTFIDSIGVGTLVVASRICQEVGVRLRLRDPNPFMANLFTVLGVAEVLGVPPTAGLHPRRLAKPAHAAAAQAGPAQTGHAPTGPGAAAKAAAGEGRRRPIGQRA
jgi:anti-anti-sigma factor